MSTFELQPTDFKITFAYYTTTKDGSGIGPTQTIIITDCFFDHQAEEKFWQLCGQGYEGVCLFDTEEVEWSTHKEVLKMEQDAIVEHLFGTTEFGETDLAIAVKYSDTE
jgi:hypothetical protein